VAEMLIAGRTDGRVVNVKSGTVMIVVGLERTHAKNVDRMNRKKRKKMRKKKRKNRKRKKQRIMNQKWLKEPINFVDFIMKTNKI
jgi:hypothetical protein